MSDLTKLQEEYAFEKLAGKLEKGGLWVQHPIKPDTCYWISPQFTRPENTHLWPYETFKEWLARKEQEQ